MCRIAGTPPRILPPLALMLLAALQQVSTAGGGWGAGPGCGSLFPCGRRCPGKAGGRSGGARDTLPATCSELGGEQVRRDARVCMGGIGESGASFADGRGGISLVSSVGEKVAERTRCGETGAVRRKAEPRVPPGQVGLQPGRPRREGTAFRRLRAR